MVNGATASDLELLRQYAQSGCAQSFAQIVRRHVAWVHSASLRQVSGDPHLAEDVTQAVFILLARRAATLPDGTLLTGWLFNTVRYAAAEARRKAARRRKHEAKAAITAETADPDSEDHAWRRLAPLLDETVALLRESERQAVLLRYFEDKTFSEIALAMGINEAAARKRVSRGVHKLREVFVNKGVIAPAVAVFTLLTRAAGAAPAPSFADAIAATACRVGPSHALALSIVRQTTLRMLRARQRLAAAIIACAGVCFLGLWALLIASMLEPDAPDIADLIDPLDATPTDLLLPAPGRYPLDPATLRADWESRRLPRPARDRANPPATDPHPPHVDRFWRLRGDLDPRNAPTASARPGAHPAKPSLPVRHDRDYDDTTDTYAGYGGMGGGGGGNSPGSRREPATPGQINSAVNLAVNNGGNTPTSRPPTDNDRVRTASSSGNAADTPAQPVGPFRGNLEHLTQTIVSPTGDRTAPLPQQGWPDDRLQIRRPTGVPSTDYVRDAIDPYPSQPPTFFGPAGALNSDGSTRGRGVTLTPVLVNGNISVTASSGRPIAIVMAPHPSHPWSFIDPTLVPGGPNLRTPSIMTHPPVTVPEPTTALLATCAAMVLSRRSPRSQRTC